MKSVASEALSGYGLEAQKQEITVELQALEVMVARTDKPKGDIT
jgi:hypothetical protein